MDTSNKSQHEYELVGVLVHTGTADSGHHYSSTKERKPAPGDPSTERRWYQFNDSNVELFDAKDITKQCYGGPEPEQITTNLQKSVTRTFPRPYSAYMLFYERCSDASNDSTSPVAEDHASNIPSDIYIHVWDDSIGFLKDRNIFDTAYFRLLWNVLHSIGGHKIDQLTSR
ncbi:3468_t:CDS:1 [Paraglomus brasilianum]|uniref:3468_t:CDS:1 n=1 Tax=Paraglomus brasilianum TaxID=144538 RepID=A0A9N9GYG8_9GLOM|nr:3468_t:CDS:1 [Paraglomus brasilianum]